MSARAHRHLTPHRIALALSEAGTDPRLLDSITSCEICRRALDVVEWWAERCDHPNPAVWPEYATAPSLLVPLLRVPPADRLERLELQEELRHWGLAVLTLEESRAWKRSPTEAWELAVLASTVASMLPVDCYGAEPVATLQVATLVRLAELQLERGQVEAAIESGAAARYLLPISARPPHLISALARLAGAIAATGGGPRRLSSLRRSKTA